jgi:hypothetical protein
MAKYTMARLKPETVAALRQEGERMLAVPLKSNRAADLCNREGVLSLDAIIHLLLADRNEHRRRVREAATRRRCRTGRGTPDLPASIQDRSEVPVDLTASRAECNVKHTPEHNE